MLPPPNNNGELPRGIHKATWVDVEQRFGQGSEVRKRAFAALKRIHEIAASTGALRSFYVFGSFVSGVPRPRDVDVLLVMEASFRHEECSDESRPLFSHGEAQARYGASVFWLRDGMLPPAAMRELLRAWQTKRDGTLRGILEIA